MTWRRSRLASDRSWRRPDWQVGVKSSEMRDDIDLRYYLDPGDQNPAPEELGRRIDDCLVHYFEVYIGLLASEEISIEEFNLVMGKIEEGMNEDVAYQAFAETLQ